MFKSAVLVSLALMSLATVSCNKDDNTTETGQKLNATPGELQGKWQSTCFPSNALEATYTQREYIFSAVGDFDKYERFFKDEGCTQQIGEYKVIGTVEAKGKASDAQDPEAEQLNLTVNNALFTVVDGNSVSLFNGLKLCGKSDWKGSEEVKVLDLNCLGSTVRKGDVIFDIYDVKDGQLYLGQSSLFLTQDSANTRPTALDAEVPFSKK